MEPNTSQGNFLQRAAATQHRFTGNRMGAISLGLTVTAWLLVLPPASGLHVRFLDVDLTGDSLVWPAIMVLVSGGTVAVCGIGRAARRQTRKWLAIVALASASISGLYWLWIAFEAFSRFSKNGI